MHTPPFTISAAFVRGMLSGICADGSSADRWLLHAGIAPALFEQVSGRVTDEQYVTLFSALMSQRDDEGLGFFRARCATAPLRWRCAAHSARPRWKRPSGGFAAR